MRKTTWIWLGVCVGVIAGGLCYRYATQELDWRGTTRLMRALEENDTQKTRRLLETTTNINARDKSGQTALSYAARYATEPVLLHKLIVAGADPFVKDKQGNTPLMIAAQYNTDPAIVLALAKHGGPLVAQTQNKNQALLLAARYNTAAVIRALLAAHASPTLTTPEGKTVADLLAENELLSAAEKTEWRQVMLVLEILEERKQFSSVKARGWQPEKEIVKALSLTEKSTQPGAQKPAQTASSKAASSAKSAQTEEQTPLVATPAQPTPTQETSPLQAKPHETSAGPLVSLSDKKSEETPAAPVAVESTPAEKPAD